MDSHYISLDLSYCTKEKCFVNFKPLVLINVSRLLEWKGRAFLAFKAAHKIASHSKQVVLFFYCNTLCSLIALGYICASLQTMQ